MSRTASIPIAPVTYSQIEEGEARRTIEQEMQSLRDELDRIRDKKGKPEVLAMRRFQFLMMGAK